MNISVEDEQKNKQPKIEFSEQFRDRKGEKQSKSEVTDHESHNNQRKSDKSEVLTVPQKAFGSKKGVVESSEVISEVSLLVIDGVIEGSEVGVESSNNSLVAENAPLLCLYLIELIEDSVHRCAVFSVLKLVEVNVIEHSEVVEQRGHCPSRSRN